MAGNRIPRNATSMDVEFLVESSIGKAGTKITANKENDGWHGTDSNGNRWYLFVGHLRNSHFCRLSNIR